MKLVYCWIDKYHNIKNQGLNFGSEWIYSTAVHSNGSLTIDREKNEKYVDDFFKLDNVGFENVTAIVGENGAGKSNILEFLATTMLKKIPMQSFQKTSGSSLGDYFFIFENERKELLLVLHNFTEDKLPKFSESEFISHKVINNPPSESRIIYYSPIYDFRNIGDSNKIINISSNYLLLNDLYSANSQNDERIESTEFHKIAETRRQLLFLNDENIKNIVEEILKKLSIPNNVTLTTSQIVLPLTPEGITNELRNIVILHPIIEKAVDFYIRERKLLTEKLLNNSQLLQYLEFLYTLFVAIIRSTDSQYFDAGNSDENFISIKTALESLPFSDNFRYEPERIDLQFKIFLDTLLDNQTYFNKENIKGVVDYLEIIAKQSQSRSVSHFTIQRAEALLFLKSYEKLINNYTNEKAPRAMTTGFLDFSWSGMSSGEVAFLNLFSRLYYARERLKENDYPSSIYLFIDEGELGFHFQWQKEYLKNLISFVPKIFKEGTKIHLIFATHSPITLSDIPNHHIVFLKKDKDKGVSILSNEEGIKHTFGANIHEILYDSFFMKDGFIGAFATEKINNVFKYLDDELTKKLEKKGDYLPEQKDLEKNKLIIRNIDEPLIRVKLEEKLAELEEGDPNAREITRLEYQQKLIEERLNNLKKPRNNDTNTRES